MPDRRPLQSPGTAERRIPLNQRPLGHDLSIGPDPSRDINQVMDKYGGLLGGGIAEEGGPMVKSLGKYLAELLGLEVGATKAGSGLPQRMRLTNATREGEMEFHAASSKAGERFRATPRQFDTLVDQGALDIHQPPEKDVAAARKKISRTLGPAK